MGGSVSAEHGIGKLKIDFLQLMYGEKHIAEMIRLKMQLDPSGMLGAGNMFSAGQVFGAGAICSAPGPFV